ncbi:NAD-dependent epimerase/dehydratase family protein [Streptomyces beijiangensis]|uniref:NAD(P)-dependent oxidoreductase n=1 Tax=Streptomyces beijiangensis TaxID=163361 RepID=A0A939JIN1_9ACTN|nr:NAD(P)-dependent oxidoreductase [Streptomyces beijiangensis]MBO0512749.1 NAD(P)-dependent oxidoreductase [Streptomyces beijiangensis]
MKVLLAGGSGILGTLATEALTADGHTVTRLGRGAANDVRADLLDRDAVLRAVDGYSFDAVVHAATALAGKSFTRHRDMHGTNVLRTTGTTHLLDAARATGARRFVAESMMFGYGYGDHGVEPLTESGTPFGPQGTDAALEQHVGAMRTLEELTLGSDGIEGICLRFGMFYGAGVTDAHMVPLLRKRGLPVVEGHGRALSFVEVGDAARAVVAAVRTDRAGRAYNIADDTPVSFAAHTRATAEAFGAPRPMTVPRWVLRAAPLARTIMGSQLRLDNTRAGAELGWKPTRASSIEGIKALAESGGSPAA